MPTEKVKKLIDSGPYTAEEALAAGLIDSVQHRQDFLAELEKRHGEDVEVVTTTVRSNRSIPRPIPSLCSAS